MGFFRVQTAEKEEKQVSTSLNNQLSVVSYLGQRELLVPDLFQLLGDKKYTCIYDVFAGSGSISFAAMKIGLARNFVINDSFSVFESLWKFIKNHPQELISEYSNIVKKYCAEPKDKRFGFYTSLLKEFNEKYQLGMMANAAILFVFLMNFSENYTPYFDDKMCMSVRANIFVYKADESKFIEQFEKRVQHLNAAFHSNQTHFTSGNFEDSLKTVELGDFVIMDPPYPRDAKNVFHMLFKEKVLQRKIRSCMEQLSKNRIDFAIFYGSRIVPLSNQFDEDQYNVHHLVRLTKHHDFGFFADHIYISRTINISREKLPAGMDFYSSYFKPNEEMSQLKYQEMMHALITRFNENAPPLQIRSKL